MRNGDQDREAFPLIVVRTNNTLVNSHGGLVSQQMDPKAEPSVIKATQLATRKGGDVTNDRNLGMSARNTGKPLNEPL